MAIVRQKNPWCVVVQRGAVCCSVLPCVAAYAVACSSVVQCGAVRCNIERFYVDFQHCYCAPKESLICCRVLQSVAVCCSVLQCVAVTFNIAIVRQKNLWCVGVYVYVYVCLYAYMYICLCVYTYISNAVCYTLSFAIVRQKHPWCVGVYVYVYIFIYV